MSTIAIVIFGFIGYVIMWIITAVLWAKHIKDDAATLVGWFWPLFFIPLVVSIIISNLIKR